MTGVLSLDVTVGATLGGGAKSTGVATGDCATEDDAAESDATEMDAMLSSRLLPPPPEASARTEELGVPGGEQPSDTAHSASREASSWLRAAEDSGAS